MDTHETIANAGPSGADSSEADLLAAAEALRMWIRTLRVDLSADPSDEVSTPLAPHSIPPTQPSAIVQVVAPQALPVIAEVVPIHPGALLGTDAPLLSFPVEETKDVLRERPLFEGLPESTSFVSRARAVVATAATSVVQKARHHGPAVAQRTAPVAGAAIQVVGRRSLAFARWGWPHVATGVQLLRLLIVAFAQWVWRLVLTAFKTLRRPTPSMKLWVRRLIVTTAAVAVLAGATWTARASWTYWRARHSNGTAILESDPPGSDVLVDGTLVGQTPYEAQLTPGRHVVVFKRRRVARTMTVDVVGGKSISTRLDWNAPVTGRLRVLSDPIGASVNIDGTDRGVTPLTLDDLPVGSHAVVLQSSAGIVRKTVVVSEERQAEISEAIYSGWLQVSAPIELEILDGTRPVVFNDKSRVLIPAGAHTIRLRNSELGFNEERRVDVQPGAVVSITIRPRPSSVTVTSSEPADIFVDGVPAGPAPVSGYPVNIGMRQIVARNASGVERRVPTMVTMKPAHLDIDFSKP